MCKEASRNDSCREWIIGGFGAAGVIAASLVLGLCCSAKDWSNPISVAMLVLLVASLGMIFLAAVQGHQRGMREQSESQKANAKIGEELRRAAVQHSGLELTVMKTVRDAIAKREAEAEKSKFQELIGEKKKALEEALNALVSEVGKETPSLSEVSKRAKEIMEVLNNAK